MPSLLDLRHLPPPEPMQRILEAVQQLSAGERLEALTPFRPEPLLPLLAEQGCAWHIESLPSGGVRITICRQQDAALLPPPTQR